MATLLNFVGAVFFCILITGGSSGCTLDDIRVDRSKTGGSVGSKPEWNVTISNGCICSQLELKLACNGFQTAKEIDPSLLAKSSDECLLNNGLPVYGFATFSFTYAWDDSFPFKPLSSQIACSH